jgi:hypothetical protein
MNFHVMCARRFGEPRFGEPNIPLIAKGLRMFSALLQKYDLSVV